MKEVKKLQHSEALDVILDEFLKLHVGQGKDIYWRDSQNIDCPTEEEYKQMVIDSNEKNLHKILLEKTYSLFLK